MAKYSHSQIQMYLSCPLKFCYEKIEKIRPDIPNESLTLVLGTATHKALEELYKKVINYCEMHGPDPEYNFLMELLEDIAKSSNGVDPEEQGVMSDFVQELTDKFKEDINRING